MSLWDFGDSGQGFRHAGQDFRHAGQDFHTRTVNSARHAYGVIRVPYAALTLLQSSPHNFADEYIDSAFARLF